MPLSHLMLKPAQLRLIRAVAESGQLQLAAESCAMTQPAASRMLAEVERRVDAPLFTRQPKGMEPTEIGLAVLRRARAVLRELESMGSDIEALRSGHAGRVRIGAVTGPAVGYLVPAIRAVKRASPESDISVEVLPSRDLLGYLAAGEMDFILARVLPEFDSELFDITPMRDEKIVFLVRANHPLARSPFVTMTELGDYEWILQQRGAPIREATFEAFAALGLSEPRDCVNSPSLLFTIAYLAQSDAVAAVSEEVAQLLIRDPVNAGFAVLRIQQEFRVSSYYLLGLRRRPLSPLALRLREELLQLSGQAS
ncbi:LysR family transcriptional regulator [Thioclava sediminum]|uniref:LysR family transcriptional regulator n=3 Tax=Thioclava TaxID=285107 RepID=A0ABX6YXY7_9RHOB|nr:MULTISPECIES: LysR family transcriptional regulator [Thioclava]MPQ93205.1 LysR family transcriptional regulator [Thioclava sp. JE_KL1]OOY05632.1 LysR family transcriptional regulator [Thioclava sp. F28-4]OOY23998.1 LysR family transcriptional regulator [Thioclava sediminum]QPZ92025.1 LysR family transcriptional regulator [Thioclava electrotropha]